MEYYGYDFIEMKIILPTIGFFIGLLVSAWLYFVGVGLLGFGHGSGTPLTLFGSPAGLGYLLRPVICAIVLLPYRKLNWIGIVIAIIFLIISLVGNVDSHGNLENIDRVRKYMDTIHTYMCLHILFYIVTIGLGVWSL